MAELGPYPAIRAMLVDMGIAPEHVDDFWVQSDTSALRVDDGNGMRALYRKWIEAQIAPEYDANGYPLTPEGWLDVQHRDREALIHILWRSAMPGSAPITVRSYDYKFLIADAEQIIEERCGLRPTAAQIERAVALRVAIQYVRDTLGMSTAERLDAYLAEEVFGVPGAQEVEAASKRFDTNGKYIKEGL